MSQKPLGAKAYGSIPHMPGSRVGAGDYHCHEGQLAICTIMARDRHDRIIVTEKLDGSCVAVCNIAGEIVALNRAGYLASSSPHAPHQHFAAWMAENDARFAALPVGHRIVGEWLSVAHGTIYQSSTPLVAFDVMAGHDRLPHDAARAIMTACGVMGAYVIHDGPPISIAAAMDAVGPFGYHGATEQIEGAVWRVERAGAFDFMAKFVREDKIDGKYLAGCAGNAPDADPVYNYCGPSTGPALS